MSAGRALNKVVLQLVKGDPERKAVEAGQVDAILDPATGSAFLLPAAQRWLLQRAAQAPATDAPDRSAHATLDGLAIEVCALDANGMIVSANRAWRDAASDCFAGVAEGDNYLVACDAAHGGDHFHGIALAAGIRQVLAGERKRFRYEHTSDLRPARWFAFNVSRAIGDSAARAIVSREDITERRRSELLFELECAVGRGLAASHDAATALKSVIRIVCEALGWDCGRYFRLDPAGPMLRFHEGWGVSLAGISQFLQRSRQLVFHPGAGLMGRVYRTGQPLWLIAGAADAGIGLSALAPESDSDGTFIFSVSAEHTTLGVLAFSGRTVREPDGRLLQIVRTIGTQLGHFLQHQEAQDALRRSEARFRRLTELSSDWYWEQDRNFRFTEYVEAGTAKEGALGKTLWELPGIVAGSADWAAHRAQLSERWSFCDFEYSSLHADGRRRDYCISGEPVFDDAGSFVGYRGTGMDITRRK